MKTEKHEFMSVEEKEKMEEEFGAKMLPFFFRDMLKSSLIDRDRVNDFEYINDIFRRNIDEFIFEVPIEIHQGFLETAQYAIDNGNPHVAIVLIATAVEHSLNLYYREIFLLKGLTHKEITQVIRSNNIQAKLSWLLFLSGEIKIPEDIIKKINYLVELRNAVVHFKAVPDKWDDNTPTGSWNDINQKLKNVNFAELMEISDKLDNLFDTYIYKIDEDRRLAVKITKMILELADM